MTVNVDRLAISLNEAITPAGEVLSDAQFNFDALAFVNSIDPAVVNSWPAGFRQNIDRMFVTLLFTNAFGMPKRPLDDISRFPLLYTASRFISYSNGVLFFLGSLGLFTSQAIALRVLSPFLSELTCFRY
jgi:hypothetical protein